VKITKKQWYALGGFSNPYLYRRMRRNGKQMWWEYFQEIR